MGSARFERIGTFSTELWRIHLRGAPALPASLVLKRAVPGREERVGESFANEVRLYREVSDRIPARVPSYYGSGTEPGAGLQLLFLEDIGTLPATDWMEGPEDSHARAAASALARIHAAFQGKTRDLGWIPAFSDRELLANFEAEYARSWPSHREFFAEIVPAFAEVGDAILGHVATSHAPLAEGPTLLHGDAHAENFPMAGDDVVLLDWAGPRLGNPGLDLGFFIPMSFPARRRPAVERALVDHHAAEMRSCGAIPAADPWLAYRRGVLRRITRIVGSAPTWDPATLSGLRMVFHRCATAAVELRVRDLL